MEKPKDLRTKEGKLWKKLQESIAEGNIGDAISHVTKAAGIEECDGCNARKEILNFGDKKNITNIKITNDELKVLDEFYESDQQNTFHSKDMARAFRSINNKYFPKYGVRNMTCRRCNQRMVDRVRKLWETNKKQ